MSDERLSWALQFDLTGDGLQQARAEMDNLQASLKKGQKAVFEFEVAGKKMQVELEGMGSAAKKTEKDVNSLGGALDRIKSSVKDFAHEHWAAIGAVSAFAGAVAYGLKQLDEFGTHAIEAFGERNSTLRAYTALLGDAKKAQQEFNWDQGFGKAAPFKTEDIEMLHKRMIASGTMNVEEARAGTLAISDLAALQGGERGQIALHKGSQMYAEIGEQGVNKRLLRAISTDLNLSIGRMVAEVAKTQNLSPEAVEKKIHSGDYANEAGGKLFQRAIQDATLHLLGTNKLGDYSAKSSTSLGTLLINQEEQVKRLMKTFDSDSLPAVGRYREALMEQAKLFDVSTEKGKNVVATLQDFANTSINLKSDWTDFVTGVTDSFTESYAKTMEQMGVNQEGFEKLSDSARAAGLEVGTLGGGVFSMTHAFEEMAPVIDITVGTLVLMTKTIGLLGTVIKDTILSLTPGFLYGGSFKDQKDAFLHMGKTANEWGAAAANGGFAPGQAPWELRAARAKAWAEKGADHLRLPGTNLGSAFSDEKKGGLGHGSAKAGKGGKGGGGGLYSVGGDFRPDYSGLAGGVVLPGVSIPGLSGGMSFASVPYQAEQQHALAAGIEARKPVPAIVKIDDITITVEGDMDAKAVAEQIADTLRGLGRYARTPSPGAL